jgi:diphthamide biosynthesis enzyme Dph1/Dph2-like protein
MHSVTNLDDLHSTTQAGLKKACNRAGKKTYTFIMGKLNPAKLANFMEIDVFVLIACRENTLMESRDFYKPIVTPFEMEMACTRGVRCASPLCSQPP